jgi:Ca2+-binding RTX toxin-like protein
MSMTTRRRDHWGLALLVLGLAWAGMPAGAAPANCLGEALTEPVGTLVGTAGRDVLLGTSADESMQGLGGNDVLCGGGGGDSLYGGAGVDNLAGGDGDDRLYGQGGCDHLKGGTGNDLLFPGPAGALCAGSLEGQGGRDRFVISAVGKNDVFGGLGKDTLDFRKSPVGLLVDFDASSPTYDFIDVLTTNSVIYDVEVVFGSQFDDSLTGGEDDDDLRGFGGNDHVYGGDGDDRLIGGDGEDWVDGFSAHDVCEGEHPQECSD